MVQPDEFLEESTQSSGLKQVISRHFVNPANILPSCESSSLVSLSY